LKPGAKVFTIREETALDRHKRAIARYNEKHVDSPLQVTTLHEYRHGFAVMYLRRAFDHQWLKQQLGQRPTRRSSLGRLEFPRIEQPLEFCASGFPLSLVRRAAVARIVFSTIPIHFVA
jgi:hypothetical protein